MSPCKFSVYLVFSSPFSLPSLNFSVEVRLRQLAGGGDDGNRTHDPLLAGQVLSQLSYTPIFSWGFLFMSEQSLKIEQQVSYTHITKLHYLSVVYLFWFCSISEYALTASQ